MIRLQTADLRVNPAAETIQVGDLAVRFLLTGDNSSGGVAAFEMIVPGGERLPAPAHSHEHYEETIYDICGVLTFVVEGKTFEIGPGQTLCIPRGAVHSFENNTSQDTKTLCIITPAAIGAEHFREVAEVLRAASGGPPDHVKLAEIMLSHGLKPATPPA